MARKKPVRRSSRRPGQRAKEPTVWVEMGPLWMERSTKKGKDLIRTEQNRRIVQGPRRRPARKKR
jgi:hypothetical protein